MLNRLFLQTIISLGVYCVLSLPIILLGVKLNILIYASLGFLSSVIGGMIFNKIKK